ncbi:MAG: PAS domain S-box protein [Gallionella sp.]
MERDYLLSILYEMALVIGGEVNVKPLLTKTLQRLLYHTSFPAGFVCLGAPFAAADDAGMVEARIDTAVGDYELAGLIGKTVRLPADLLFGEAERGENAALLSSLPGKVNLYKGYLRLPIEGQGVIVLLAPQLPDSELPLTQLFQPVMDSLSRAIVLCRSYEAYTGSLIAARDASQQALESSEEKSKAISAAVLDGLIMVDNRGALVYWNPAAERILGYRADEVLGKPLHQLLTPQRYQNDAIRGFDAFRSTGQGAVIGKTIETEALHKDGHEVPVELSISALKLDGRWHAVGILRDNTEHKRAEATRTQLAAIVESSNDAIIGKTIDGIITSWNKGAERIYGYRADEVVGRHITVLAAPERHAEIHEFLEKIRSGENVANYESERLRKDGSLIQVALTLSPIRDASGAVAGVSTIARDITENKLLQEELRHAGVYNRSLIEASLDPLVTISAEGKITDVNRATEKVTGRDRGELIGTDFSDYFTEPDEARKGYLQVFQKGSVTDYPLALRHRDGHIVDVLYNASVYRDEAGRVLGVFAAARDITERKKAEFVLRQSEEALKEAQRIAHLGSWHLDLATNQVVWSEELYKLYGFDPTLPPPPYTESAKLFTPESWERLSTAIARATETGASYELELETVQRNGSRGWMLARGELVHDASGAAVQVRGVVMDITGRKQAEEQLRRSEHGLAEAQRIAHLGSWELNLENNALVWSDEIYRIFEIDKKKFGASYEAFLNAIHPDDREMVNKAYTNSVANWGTYDIVHRLLMPDGRIKYVNEKCETYYGEDGKPLRSVGTVHDITERVQDEQALQRLNRELRAISNCNQALMRAEDEQALLDEICRIICDDAGYRMAWVGYAENDEARTIRPVSWAGVESGYLEQARLTWADTERGRGPSGVAIRTGKSVSIQDFVTDPNAAPWRAAALQRGYRSSISLPIKDEGGTAFGILNIYAVQPNAYTRSEVRLLEELAGDMAFGIMVLRDRIERRRAEDEIRTLNLELEQRVAERTAQLEAANKELEAFSYSVSHDLRTPLRAIDGFSHILQEDYADKLDAEGLRILNVVRDNTVRMGQLIDDILKFSRAGRLELTRIEIDMEKMARDVFDELQPVVDEDKLQLEIDHLPPAQGDRAMMHQVFVNLLSNAIKFSRFREPARIRVGASIEGDEVIYYVRDNGTGFDMQYADKLFGVFQRLHGVAEFEGTGIGLAIVKRIVTRHGGRVWAEGKIDQGATMYFALPRTGRPDAER